MGVHSKLVEEALDTTQKKFEATSKGLEPLAASMRLVAALEQAYLAETRHLQQAAESSMQKLALVEATANPSRFQPEETDNVKERSRAKPSEALVNQIKQILPSIDRRYNPFRDSDESNINRHSNEFWEGWLFGDSTSPQTLYCWGPAGVGKSTITSRVIETLEYIENIYAYYYLGEGNVQSADRLALSLLSQLCDLTNVYSSSIDSSRSNKVSDRILSTADNVSGRLETFESSETTVELTDPITARPGIDAAHESDGPARPSNRGLSFGDVLKQIATHCLRYQLQIGLQDVHLETGAGVEELLRLNPFLAHAAKGWSIYCRESLKSTPPPLPPGDGRIPDTSESSETTRDSPDHAADSTDTQVDCEVGGESEAATTGTVGKEGVPVQTTSTHLHTVTLARELLESRDRISLSMLLSIYLIKDPSTASSTWGEFHSWVTSMSKLHIAARLGLVDLVQGELDRDPLGPSKKDERGSTPLHEAVRAGFEDVVHVLLKAGALPDDQDKSEQTPMDYAIQDGYHQIFVLLFEEFCESFYATDRDKILRLDKVSRHRHLFGLADHYFSYISADRETALHPLDLAMVDAIAKGKAGVVRYLLDHGANPNCKDDNKIPALHRAIQLVSEDYTKGHAVLGLLLDRGADPSIKSSDEKGESGLHIAARSGDIEVARMLIGDGADPRSQDSQGRPILFAMLEAEVDEYEIGYLQSLLLYGADVEQADKNGRRVLHLAAERGLTGFMWRLLHEGASSDPVDNQGKTPLIYAQEAGCLEAEAMLRSFTRR